jgi:hypothetical protein
MMMPNSKNVWLAVWIARKMAIALLCFRISVLLGFVYVALVLFVAALSLRKIPLAK